MSEGLTYLASPYSHPDPAVREYRFREACRATAKLMLRGERVYSPIAHGHAVEVAHGTKMGGHEFWLPHCFAILRLCARMKVLRLDGWEASEGIADEVAVCGRIQIPVLYIDP